MKQKITRTLHWSILRFLGLNNTEVFYRLLCVIEPYKDIPTRWRINSGIVRVDEDDDYYLVHGESGSIYKCHKNDYVDEEFTKPIRMRILMELDQFHKFIQLKDRENWCKFDFQK